jgi:selenide,water dikinase
VRTGAATRNWSSYGDAVTLPDSFEDWRRDVLCDPQTSGGLLIAVASEAAPTVLAMAVDAGFANSAVVGRLVAGPPTITVRR